MVFYVHALYNWTSNWTFKKAFFYLFKCYYISFSIIIISLWSWTGRFLNKSIRGLWPCVFLSLYTLFFSCLIFHNMFHLHSCIWVSINYPLQMTNELILNLSKFNTFCFKIKSFIISKAWESCSLYLESISGEEYRRLNPISNTECFPNPLNLIHSSIQIITYYS